MGGGTTATSIVLGPGEGYAAIVDKGEQLCKAEKIQIFMLSVYAGGYIGFGALLSLTISGNIDGTVMIHGNGVSGYIYAVLFPVNLLFILLSGCILYTGATFTTPAAWIEGRANIVDVASVIIIAWIGNIVGSVIFALLTEACGLNEGGVARLAVSVLQSKTSKGFGEILLRGIGCNWLVCMAVYLCSMAQDMTGKYVGIVFPISTFVACGFEHYPANAYALPLGYIASLKDDYKVEGSAGIGEAFGLNLIPCSIGNLIAGVFIMACGFSYFFGSLRDGVLVHFKKRQQPQTQEEKEYPSLTAVENFRTQGEALPPVAEQAPQDGGTTAEPPTEMRRQVSPGPIADRPNWVQAIAHNEHGFARTVSC
jgi:formate/nitrite transporter